jgi:hypothetical protein
MGAFLLLPDVAPIQYDYAWRSSVKFSEIEDALSVYP